MPREELPKLPYGQGTFLPLERAAVTTNVIAIFNAIDFNVFMNAPDFIDVAFTAAL